MSSKSELLFFGGFRKVRSENKIDFIAENRTSSQFFMFKSKKNVNGSPLTNPNAFQTFTCLTSSDSISVTLYFIDRYSDDVKLKLCYV